MSLTVKPDNPQPPAEPPRSEIHPLVVLSLALSLAVGTGFLAGWAAAVTVLLAVLALFGRGRPGPTE